MNVLFFDVSRGSLHYREGGRYIELGGGAYPAIRPNVDVRPCADAAGNPTVDFLVNMELPFTEEHGQAISSGEFDGVFSKYALEHVSYRRTDQILSEIARILKPGGSLVLILPNTEEQCRHLLRSEDWDDASCMLFGDQDYGDNTHKAFLSPLIITRKLEAAGFDSVVVSPWGEKRTDMVVQAKKKEEAAPSFPPIVLEPKRIEAQIKVPEELVGTLPLAHLTTEVTQQTQEVDLDALREERRKMFGRTYFDGQSPHGGYGFYRDFPVHELTLQHVLLRRPSSVFQLGASRGYILHRLEREGIPCRGVDISEHCHLTRISNKLDRADATDPRYWDAQIGTPDYDLCFSVAFWDHIPEALIPHVVEGMRRLCKRGLHGINTRPDGGGDRTRCTIKPLEWWRKTLGEGHEVAEKDELENGQYRTSYFEGDGKLKLHLGSYQTMMHHGWQNVDVVDLTQFAQQQNYRFTRLDLTEGLHLWGTESVDMIATHHALEHLTYEEGAELLRECRRVMKPGAVMRISVPSMTRLLEHYDDGTMNAFDELSGTCASARTGAAKLYELLHAHHKSVYDEDAMRATVEAAGMRFHPSRFRLLPDADHATRARCAQVLNEVQESLAEVSLFCWAVVPN